jgi:hypothetical protein
MGQSLPPGVQDGEEADIRAEMLWVGGDNAQRLRRGSKENVGVLPAGVRDYGEVVDIESIRVSWYGGRIDVES